MYIVVILNMYIVWCCVWFIVIAHSIFHNKICCAAFNLTCVPLPHVIPPLSHHDHMAIKRGKIKKIQSYFQNICCLFILQCLQMYNKICVQHQKRSMTAPWCLPG